MSLSGLSAVLWCEAKDFARAPHGLGGTTLLEAHVQSLRRAHIRDIAVVQPAAEATPGDRLGDVQLILMPHGWFTPFDALVMGLFAIDRRPVLIMPADHDVVADGTLDRLIAEATRAHATHALIPTFNGQRGYPVVLFPAGVEALVREAANPNGHRQLDTLLDHWSGGVRDFPVTDHAVTQDFAAQA
jgi:CTP:molybdopterin cytidylyltransferase MocA